MASTTTCASPKRSKGFDEGDRRPRLHLTAPPSQILLAASVDKGMLTFAQWLTLESYYGLAPDEYNALFNSELEKVIGRVRDPAQQAALQRMRNFNWVGYIAASVWNAGYRDQRERDEKTHEVVVKLLMGQLFKGFNEKISGPLDLRFRRSVSNAIKNIVEKEKNRRRLHPSVPIGQEFEPGTIAAADLPDRVSYGYDEQVTEKFRELVRRQLGDLGLLSSMCGWMAVRRNHWSVLRHLVVRVNGASRKPFRKSRYWDGNMPFR